MCSIDCSAMFLLSFLKSHQKINLPTNLSFVVLRRTPGGRKLWESKDDRKWGHDKFEELTVQERSYEEVNIHYFRYMLVAVHLYSCVWTLFLFCCASYSCFSHKI